MGQSHSRATYYFARGRKGIRPEWWGVGMVTCLGRGADLHMAQLMPLPLAVSFFSKIQISFIFLVPAHLGNLGQRTVKRLWLLLLILQSTVLFHLLYLSVSQHSRYRTEIASLSTVRRPLGHH